MDLESNGRSPTSLVCELSGRSVTQSAVGTDGIVVALPRLHNVTSLPAGQAGHGRAKPSRVSSSCYPRISVHMVPSTESPLWQLTTVVAPLLRCLSLDLEVSIRDGRIRALAGVRPDIGQSLVFPAARGGLAAALARLDHLSEGADFLLGHNLIAFDIPHLQTSEPKLAIVAAARGGYPPAQSL